jgi:UDP:flavonoid glycosyltransferase YjiC (YdhE family)
MSGISDVFTEAVQAVANLDVDVLITVGRSMNPDSLGPLPPRIRVEHWVDQRTVLHNASAVLCHGGGGSVIGALAAGVPIVGVPLFAEDQHINAHRVAAVGAGLTAARQHQAMRQALCTVLARNQYRAAAKELASEMDKHTSTDDLPLASVLRPA